MSAPQKIRVTSSRNTSVGMKNYKKNTEVALKRKVDLLERFKFALSSEFVSGEGISGQSDV